MKRFWLIVLLLPSVVFLAQSQQTKLATRQGFTVSLPVSVDPETVKIHASVKDVQIRFSRFSARGAAVRLDHTETIWEFQPQPAAV